MQYINNNYKIVKQQTRCFVNVSRTNKHTAQVALAVITDLWLVDIIVEQVMVMYN